MQRLCKNSDYAQFLVRVGSRDFVDRLLGPKRERSTKSRELTLTKPQGPISFRYYGFLAGLVTGIRTGGGFGAFGFSRRASRPLRVSAIRFSAELG